VRTYPQGSAISFRSMNTYVHPLGKTRLAKNTYGADFHLLSAGLIGHVTCSLRTLPRETVVTRTQPFVVLRRPVTQSHIHVGQLGVTGSVVIFLCQTAANPDPT
jgi:hypothetical protein